MSQNVIMKKNLETGNSLTEIGTEKNLSPLD